MPGDFLVLATDLPHYEGQVLSLMAELGADTVISYPQSSYPITDLGPAPSDGGEVEPLDHHRPLHPIVVVGPIVGFAIIAGLLFAFLYRRRRRSQTRAGRMNGQEMMTRQPQPLVQPHFALPWASPTPLLAIPSSLSPPPPPVQPQPVILGPILTGADSSYLTGIDMTDEALVGLEERPSNPFADDHSIAEPPPPYRPRSATPPSFAAADAAASSHIALFEPSPFADPEDSVSQPSESDAARDEEVMSVVSDLSDRHDAHDAHAAGAVF